MYEMNKGFVCDEEICLLISTILVKDRSILHTNLFSLSDFFLLIFIGPFNQLSLYIPCEIYQIVILISGEFLFIFFPLKYSPILIAIYKIMNRFVGLLEEGIIII